MGSWYSSSGYSNAMARAAASGGLSNPSPGLPGFPGYPKPGPLKLPPLPPLGPANSNMPFSLYGKGAGRIGLRFIPWLGWVVLILELLWLYRRYGVRMGLYFKGYACSSLCGCAVPENFIRIGQNSTCGGAPGVFTQWNPKVHGYPNTLGTTEGNPGRRSRNYTRVLAPRPSWIPQPTGDPFAPGEIAPETNPAIDPSVAPIGSPVPVPAPAPVPWRAIPDLDPYPNGPVPEWPPFVEPEFPPEVVFPPVPVTQPAPSPSPGPLPGPVPSPVPVPVPGPSTGPQPGPVPVPVPTPVARGKPSKVIRSKPRRRKRPGRREKEQKRNFSAPGMAVMFHLVHAVTETLDVIEAFWWALPARYRTPPRWVGDHWEKPDPYKMSLDVYRHWDKVDFEKAVHDAFMNVIEDFGIGKLGKAVAGANIRADLNVGNFGAVTGWQTGPAL